MTADEDIARFRNAAMALAGAEKTVMKEVGKSLRSVSRPVVNQIRAEVRSSKGESPKGAHSSTADRQLYTLSRARSLYDPATGLVIERRAKALQRKLVKVARLRDSIAAASGASVSASDRKVSLAFKVRAGNLPPSQRKLPRRWDNPSGWKHPVFGNRKNWVKQVGHPYFRTTVSRSRDQLTAGVVAAMAVAAEKITHPDEGSAS